jgi:hypothetical protein
MIHQQLLKTLYEHTMIKLYISIKIPKNSQDSLPGKKKNRYLVAAPAAPASVRKQCE